ncbi:helix-turn-helix transcriptional regulator [Streptomyces armeniacus]|uniref:helix-turn-helix transcriptional regulator n=1 Tax=Streptomyces armeniacus TaxID=83291 RepID=UPI003CCC7599
MTTAQRNTAARRRPELAAFLRSRRARVTPADVGMPPGLRRRTPGLRREEVAQLSGVGVTWYTWLEQGRRINASAQVLDAVARTLRLDAAEREHLYHLAEVPFFPEQLPSTDCVGAELQGVLDAVETLPAVIYNSRYDILGTNAQYRAVFRVPQARAGVRNVLWTLFTGDRENCPLVFRDSELRVMVAMLRGAYGRHVGEPAWESFIRRLSEASPEFVGMWTSGDVVPPGPRVKTFRHAAVDGEIRMSSVSLAVNGMPEARMVVHTPSDDESRALIAEIPPLERDGTGDEREWS